MGLLSFIVTLAKHPGATALVRIGIGKAGDKAEAKIESGEWTMTDARREKWDRLLHSNRSERQARREAGLAWWQKSARDTRQERRQDWWGGLFDGDEESETLPTGVPGPGEPGSRTTGSRDLNGNGNGIDWTPIFWTGVVASTAWLLYSKKKKR